MNLTTFERAIVAEFAYSEARETGSLDAMKAILYVLRNRVKAGWGDGTWLSVLRSPFEHAVSAIVLAGGFDTQDRLLQMLIRDVDDIYMGNTEEPVKDLVDDALFWQFVNREVSPEFVEKIVRDEINHMRIGSLGFLVFYR